MAVKDSCLNAWCSQPVVNQTSCPRGAPVLIDSTEDNISFIRTLCSRFVKKSRVN